MKDKGLDPIALLEESLLEENILTQDKISAIYQELKSEIDSVAAEVEKFSDPPPHTFAHHVYSTTYPQIDITEKKPSGEEVFIVDALNKALDEELSLNPEMVIFGQDVAHGKGGVFTVTKGLTAKYGKSRVFNAPLAEASITGAAIGMATLGMKPVAEIQFGDYVWTAMMQLRNELSNMLYRSNGDFSCPAVIRIPVGGYIHGSLFHSQNIEATFSHFPGLVIIFPSNATDAKGLLKSAIRASDPVLFLEHKGLYRQVYAKGSIGTADDLIPIGLAKIVRPGTDATIISWGALVHKSILAAEAVAKLGAEVEVIDIRTILPLDARTIINSVKKTGRLLIAHEDAAFMGFGAEIAATAANRAFEYLDAPIRRVAGAFTPIANAPSLEQQILPQNENIENALRELLDY